MRGLVAVAFASTACQQVFGLDEPTVAIDAKTSIVLSGQTFDLSGPMLGDCTVRWELDAGNAVVTSQRTDSMGHYTLVLPYAGAPLAGHLHALHPNYLDTYFFFPGPIDGDGTISFTLSNQSTFSTVCSAAQVTCDPTKAWLAVVVFDAKGNGLAAATVSTAPAGTVRYDDASGALSPTATTTSSDGNSFVFNVPPGSVTVDVTRTGDTFAQHVVDAHVGAFGITYMQAQP